MKISATRTGSGIPFRISGVNVPPLVSMPTECGKVSMPREPSKAAVPGECGEPSRFQRFQMPIASLT